MTTVDEIFADIKKEGSDPFAELDTETTTPSESQPEKEQEKEEPALGDNPKETEEDKTEPSEEDTPFHKRWEKREEKLRAEMQEEFESYKRELDQKIEDRTKKESDIPEWFTELYGDNQVAWQKYSAHEDARTEAIKKQVLEEQENKVQKEKDESAKWERWVDDEVKKLEDQGLKFDKNELIKTAIDWRPTDEKGNYDLKKAYDILEMKKSKDTSINKEKSDERKRVADTTTKASRGEAPKKDYMTPADLRKTSWNQL